MADWEAIAVTAIIGSVIGFFTYLYVDDPKHKNKAKLILAGDTIGSFGAVMFFLFRNI